jgi:hypothetical protein
MKNCKEYQSLLEKIIAGDINKNEHAELLQHIDSCSECTRLYSTNKALLQMNKPIDPVSKNEFNTLRLKVIEKINQQNEKSFAIKVQKIIDTMMEYFKKPEYALAAITLIVGFFLGRALPPDENGIAGGFLKQISSIAEQNTYLSDTQKSSYRFSNVSLKEMDNNKISMSFDVSTSLDFVRQKDDPLVKEILTQTMLETENVGTNLKAISYSESILDNKIKQALIYSMLNAPVTAVRLKSMEGLLKYKIDPELQEAFLKVLSEEETIKMNLLAIDYLTKNNYNADSLKSIIEEADPKKSTAIFVRAKKNNQIKP